MVKFHHAAIDGVAGAEVLTTLLDATPEAPDETMAAAAPWRPEPVPGELEMWLRGLAGVSRQPLRMLEFQGRLLRVLPGAARVLARSRGLGGGRGGPR